MSALKYRLARLAWHWRQFLAAWDGPLFALALAATIAGLLFLVGCASFTEQYYEWKQTKPASEKPWIYYHVIDVDLGCRALGAQAVTGREIGGCAIWKPKGCVMILPPNVAAWILEHEERHCAGWVHQ